MYNVIPILAFIKKKMSRCVPHTKFLSLHVTIVHSLDIGKKKRTTTSADLVLNYNENANKAVERKTALIPK